MRLRVAAHRRAKADQFSCGCIRCSLCHWRLLLVLGNKPRGKFPVAWSHGVLSMISEILRTGRSGKELQIFGVRIFPIFGGKDPPRKPPRSCMVLALVQIF